MSNTAIVFVPGSFCPPVLYSKVIDAVKAHGHDIRALHIPSIGLGPNEPGPGAPTMADDAAFIAREVESLADAGKDVVLVAHSYGGIPTSESVAGLRKTERQQQGKTGGIVRVGYVTGVVPELNGSAANVMSQVPPENTLNLSVDVSCPLID
jgi:pimeloyl-ACP methyl ester carboxylesterase